MERRRRGRHALHTYTRSSLSAASRSGCATQLAAHQVLQVDVRCGASERCKFRPRSEITVVLMTTQPDLDAQLAAERAETERVFGAQARLYSSISDALTKLEVSDTLVVERPAGDSYTCESCLALVTPAEPLTATWIERRVRAAAFDWRLAGVDYVTAACTLCRDDVVAAIAARGDEQAAISLAEWESVSDNYVVTYVHGSVDWLGDDAS